MTSPSSGTDRDKPKRADFLLPWEIVVAPARAFERIAALPEWMIGYAVVVALMLISAALEYPALLHLDTLAARAAHEAVPDPRSFTENLLLACAINPLVGLMLQAVAIAIFAATRDVKNFAKYPAFVSLAANAGVIWAIGEVISGIAVRLRDPMSFTDERSLDTVLPIKLTFLAAKGNADQAFFLSHFGIFDTWSMIVLSFGLARLAKVGLVPALVFVFTLDLAFAFIK